ncbi:hypothetical protein ACFW17_35505 [Streptomyces sp. NPDC058961]|uniref:hypothetical protein n=1 Tax=Streptomyces sp. NPDC058961 TaxID=3346680 RepID=UPI00368B7EF9
MQQVRDMVEEGWMTQVSPGELDDRVLGRTWTVRLDAAGRSSAAVRVSCSRPACVPERLATAAAGRSSAAVAHLKAHLKAMAGPRAQAFCVCKAEHCHLHTPAARFDERPDRGVPWRCGGPVVLAVVTDREGRWWRAMECCSRCAAATPGATTVATAPLPPQAVSTVADAARPVAAPVGGPQFSDRPCAGGSQMVPAARSTRQRPARHGRIAGHVVPHGLRPLELRDELTELGDRFRSYQQRTEPDLALLTDLHTRKAAAFTRWAVVTGDRHLRREAQRAEQAAQTARLQHRQRATRTTDDPDGDVPRPWPGC